MPLREELGASVAKSIDVLAVAHWLHFVLAVLERFPINGKYWAAYLCQMVWWQGSVWPLLQSLKWKERQEIVQIMGVRNSDPAPDPCCPQCVRLDITMQVSVFTVHTAQLSALPEPFGT